jgi:hypothetical protein
MIFLNRNNPTVIPMRNEKVLPFQVFLSYIKSEIQSIPIYRENKSEIQIFQCSKQVRRSKLYIGDANTRVLAIGILVIWYYFEFRISIFVF